MRSTEGYAVGADSRGKARKRRSGELERIPFMRESVLSFCPLKNEPFDAQAFSQLVTEDEILNYEVRACKKLVPPDL